MWFIWGPPWCWTNPIQHFFPRDLPIDPPSLVPHETGKNSEVGHHQADKCTEGDDAIFNAAPGCMMKHPTWNITTRMAENPYNTLKDILNNNANNIQVNIIFEIAWFLFYPEQSLKNSCQTNVSVFFFNQFKNGQYNETKRALFNDFMINSSSLQSLKSSRFIT